MQQSGRSSGRGIGRGLAMFGLALLATSATAGQPLYRLEPIARIGDAVGDTGVTASIAFVVGGLNDHGQITFGTIDLSGGWSTVLFQYGDGRFTPLAAAGQPWSGGKWPQDVECAPGEMNQRGDVVFTAESSREGSDGSGTYLWCRAARRVTAVALAGAQAVDSLDFTAADGPEPALNNSLVLKSGMTTNLGTIGEVLANGLGLNSQGQVAVGVHFAGSASDAETLVVCTPMTALG